MFYFILHPLQWIDADCGEHIFKGERMEGGFYLISWAEKGIKKTDVYDYPDAMEALIMGYWILSDENGIPLKEN